MAKFRKKPSPKKPDVVDAWQLPIPDADTHIFNGDAIFFFKRNDGMAIEATISIPEGTMTAKTGDWIVRGVRGELSFCGPDIFAATYEPA